MDEIRKTDYLEGDWITWTAFPDECTHHNAIGTPRARVLRVSRNFSPRTYWIGFVRWHPDHEGGWRLERVEGPSKESWLLDRNVRLCTPEEAKAQEVFELSHLL